MLRFQFDLMKKIQAAAVLVRLAGGRIERLRLAKLLYIADREALVERGCPIVGGRAVAMEYGPLHSEMLDLIKDRHDDDSAGAEWTRFFTNNGNDVVMELDPDPENLELSEYEIEKLSTVSNERVGKSTWEIVEETHNFQEYLDVNRPGTSTTIPADNILRQGGYTADEIKQVIADADEHSHLVKMLR